MLCTFKIAATISFLLGTILRTVALKIPAESNEARLIGNLLRNYETRARPLVNSSEAIWLNVSMNLMQIIGVDDKKQILSISGWLNVFWRDENISWVPADYGYINYIVLPSTSIWIPDIGHTTSIDGKFDLSSDSTYKCKVYHDGRVEWFPGGIFRSGCRLMMTYFPFDRQVCNMTIESWAYNSQLLKIKRMADEVDLQPSVGNGQWIIEQTAISDMIFWLSELDGYWSKAEIQFHLQRKSGYYIMNIILPCVAISFLVLMVFHLPPDAGEKISLGITVLLAFSVFQLLIADIMPRSSDSNPVIVIYLTAFMAMAVMSIVLSVITLNIHHGGSDLRVPRWLRLLLFHGLARIVCAADIVKPYRLETRMRRLHTGSRRSTRHEKYDSDRNDAGCAYVDGSTETNNVRREDTAVIDSSNTPILFEILRELKLITTRLSNEDEMVFIAEEWRMAARIVDRFFIMIYVIVNCFVTVGCLSTAVVGGRWS